MTTRLPDPISAYYRAESRNDFETLAHLFAVDGVVFDEGETMRGRTAIAAWMAGAKAKYNHRTEALDAREEGGAWIVSVRLSGDFPNAPITLEQRFRLTEDGIAALEIG
jgi:hypothetical protein